MTTFNLTIEMDNAAFEEFGGAEVQRILAKASEQVRTAPGKVDSGTLMDGEGNTVGHWEITEEGNEYV